jgi:hypothetical protein
LRALEGEADIIAFSRGKRTNADIEFRRPEPTNFR